MLPSTVLHQLQRTELHYKECAGAYVVIPPHQAAWQLLGLLLSAFQTSPGVGKHLLVSPCLLISFSDPKSALDASALFSILCVFLNV